MYPGLNCGFTISQVTQYRVLCIGDSRLRYLQYDLNENLRHIKFTCHVFPGGTLGYLLYQLRLILMNCAPHYYDYILVAGGICDLTLLTKSPSRRVTPRYNSVAATVENFERLLSVFRESACLFTQIPIIYSPLVGIQLMHYSYGDPTVFGLQPIIDDSIPLINIMIKQINRWNGLPTPDLAYAIHHSRGHRGTYRTRYGRLVDGCHPDEQTRKIWVREILKCFTNFIYTWK